MLVRCMWYTDFFAALGSSHDPLAKARRTLATISRPSLPDAPKTNTALDLGLSEAAGMADASAAPVPC